jgi:hypothetical protein
MKNIKITLSVIILAVGGLIFTSCHKALPLPKAMNGKLYLSQNLWYQHPQKIYSVGYKSGTILPVGTEVTDIKVNRKAIFFKIANSPQQYRIIYQQKFSLLPAMQYADRLFTDKTLTEQLKAFTPAEKQFIKTGTLTKGLSKAAVLVGYGYPPPHRTPSIQSNLWRYWINRWQTQQLAFNAKGKLISF